MVSFGRFYSFLLVCGLVGAIAVFVATDSGVSVTNGATVPGVVPSAVVSYALTVPGVQALDGAQQEIDQLLADRAAPDAVWTRLRSRTEFEHLAAGAASSVISREAPSVVASAPTGVSSLPSGAHLSGYLSPTSARLQLPGGKHAILQSLTPIATRTPSDGYKPVDLKLHRTGRDFLAEDAPVPVSIPKSLLAGVELGTTGVSLIPVRAAGAALRGQGQLDGDGAVVYANTQTDADTVVKPTAEGFESYGVLRSTRSPQQLSFRIGVPRGARLRTGRDGSGVAAQVLADGRTIATIPTPSAIDAAGTPVPMSSTLSGDILRLDVAHRSGEYRYPIAVDPAVIDSDLEGKAGEPNLSMDWHCEEQFGTICANSWWGTGLSIAAPHAASVWSALVYPTQGESHIYELWAESEGSMESSRFEAKMGIFNESGWEAVQALPTSYGRTAYAACVSVGCSSSSGTAHNLAAFWLTATGEENTRAEINVQAASVYIAQANGPSISANTSSELIEGRTNVLHGSPSWLSPKTGNYEFVVTDPGVGVREVEYQVVGGSKWTDKLTCAGPVQCPETARQTFMTGGHMPPDGEPELEVKPIDGMGSSSSTKVKLKVDGTPPHEITLTGLPASGEIGEKPVMLSAHATDGTAGVISSGVGSLKLTIDGEEIGTANGSCSPGPCTAEGHWSIDGEDLAAGKHTVTVTAVDNLGNSSFTSTTITVHHAAPISMGPGSLNPVTGEFELEETDVSVPALGTPLTVTRSYGSRQPSAGTHGAFGAPWTMSFGGAQRLESREGGWTMVLVSASGQEAEFYSEGEDKYESLAGNKSLVLKANSTKTEYTLLDDGASTTFTHVSGDAEGVYRPALVTGTGGTHTTQYTYQVIGGAIEPLEVLAPVPAGVSCTPTLKLGCRALTYNFATSTTATGEASSQWGDYAGHLTRVYFTTSEGSTTVAQYAYDSNGRLRAEWDPRVSPALKTTYGYDPEGHVTAIDPPGEEPWIFTYGTTSTDPSPGRLLKLMRPSASQALWNGEMPKSTAAPKLTGSAATGVQMTSADGSWSASPIVYGYQWEDCNASGAECTPIPGATNANYTPTVSDVGHALVAEVTATNGGGSALASTSPSAVVVHAAAMLEARVGTGALNATACIPSSTTCVTSDGPHSFYATAVSTIAPASWTSWEDSIAGPSEALSCPSSSLCLLASGEVGGNGGTLYYATSLGGAWKQALAPAYGFDAISCASASFCVAGQDGGGTFHYSTSPASTSWTQENQGSGAITGVSCVSSSFCAMVDSAGYVRVATSTSQIKSSSWKETDVDGSTALTGIACTSTTSCVAIDTTGHVLDLTIGTAGEASATMQNFGSFTLIAVSCASSTCIVSATKGFYLLSSDGGKTWSEHPAGRAAERGLGLDSVACISPVLCLAADAEGSTYAINPEAAIFTKGETRSPQPGTTIEYGVPVSGAGAPYQMSSSDVAKWAQADVPTEAIAVLPPERSAGWPAKSYIGATVDYLDEVDHLVNVANPNRGITTSEYNSFNDVVRNLTADDRETALKEGEKSAEVAEQIDTQSTYIEEGTALNTVLGPLHTIKLSNGATVQARAYTAYSYDEGAPPGGPYRLATEVTEGALIPGELGVADARTTKISYAGQNNLGWALRKPTATRTDPGGLELVRTTVYDPSTGNVVETRTPGAGAPSEEISSGYVHKTAFGSFGSGNGQFYQPGGIAIDAEGNVWVADTANDRIEEFTSSGTYVQQFGGAGTGNGQLSSPQGVAIDGKGNVWVADTGNNRVQEFSSTGTYIRQTKTLYGLSSPTAILYTDSKSRPRLYVVSAGQGTIKTLNTEGEETGEFGGWGASEAKYQTLKEPEGIAVDNEGNVWASDTRENAVVEYKENGEFVGKFGSLGSGEGQLSKPQGLAVNGEGEILVADSGNNRIESFKPNRWTYQYQFGTTGEKMSAPAGLALDSSGDAYVLDTDNDRVQKWVPAASVHERSGTGGTHGEQTIYYSSEGESEVSVCNWHPAWAGLPCETRPAAQPETSGLPNLPVTSVTYNTWDEPLTSTETVGTTTRTTTNTYDAAGRLVSEQETSTVGTALPTVKFEYNSETGGLSKQSTTTGGVTRSIEYTENRRGEVTSYTDADGNTSTYYYDAYGKLESASDGKGSQTYSYSSLGQLTSLTDSAAGTFSVSYDPEGNLERQEYPNAMVVRRSYNSSGEETGLTYEKKRYCGTTCVLYEENVVPSIHGQTLSQTSTLSSEAYTYDAAGRLTKVQDTPAGEGCTTRVYSFDDETNIDSLTTRPPGSEGKCSSEGGTVINHSYDSANRLMDPGIAYDTFGDITKLPAGDAGGSEVTSSYYVDETLASQSQGGETIGYYLDPAGRDRQIVSTGTTNSTVTYHYAGNGRAPSWTEGTTGSWTRNIYGIGGMLAATQTNGEAPVFQVEDLKGNVVGTASSSETATKLLSSGDSTEYGVPRTSSPPKYSWQGALAMRTELPSGIVAMGARSYVPEIGRFLQPDPVEGGSANAYSYTYGDPIDSFDPSGEFTVGVPDWVHEWFSEEAEAATEAAIQRAAEEQAAREEAEEKAREAAEEAAEQAAVEAAEAAEAATEAQAGGGKGKKGKGKKAKASKAKAATAYTCSALYCEKGPIKIKCSSCKQWSKEEEKRKKAEERKQKEAERLKKELECGHAVSGYRPGKESSVLTGGVYYGGARHKDVCSSGDPGPDFDPPCELFGCDGGLEAWKQWPEQEPGQEPSERSPGSPRQSAHVIRV